MFDKDNKFGFISNDNDNSNNNIEGLDKVKSDLNNIKGEVNELNTQYKDIVNDNFYIKSQMVMPSKKNENNNNSYKIVKKDGLALTIVQKLNKEYGVYTFDTLNGDTNPSVSTGGSWDLIRLKKVQRFKYAYVFYKPSPISGELAVFEDPAGISIIEKNYFDLSDTVQDEFISSQPLKVGIGTYQINPNQTLDFEFKTTHNPIANILFYGTNMSSNDVDIIVNGETVKKINPRSVRLTNSKGYGLVSFPVPHGLNNEATYTVSIKNNHTSNNFYFSCFNFFLLDEYDNQYINNYKAFGTPLTWINGVGANDYAIWDSDNNTWLGSFHGGETRISAGIKIKNILTDINLVEDGFYLEKNFNIEQYTNLNNKGKMYSNFDFNNDGTLCMMFSFDGNIKCYDFYTALTCTCKTFSDIEYPIKKTTSIDTDTNINVNFGEIIQKDSSNKMKLGIRHTYFDNLFNNKGSFVRNNSNYCKYYYGAVNGMGDINKPVTIKNLMFEKSLDFIVE